MKSARLRRPDTIFVCGKCLKRHSQTNAIRRALKAQAKAADAKLVRTSCLGICPKKSVVVANRASLAAGRVLTVADAGAAATVLEALRMRDVAAGTFGD